AGSNPVFHPSFKGLRLRFKPLLIAYYSPNKLFAPILIAPDIFWHNGAMWETNGKLFWALPQNHFYSQ
ncbi:MAG: hypothetical protein DRP64_10085, partial [Verrucomicrobia bacterium]